MTEESLGAKAKISQQEDRSWLLGKKNAKHLATWIKNIVSEFFKGKCILFIGIIIHRNVFFFKHVLTEYLSF